VQENYGAYALQAKSKLFQGHVFIRLKTENLLLWFKIGKTQINV